MSDDTVLSHSFDNLDSNATVSGQPQPQGELGMRSQGWRYMFRLSHTIRFVTIGHREDTFRYELTRCGHEMSNAFAHFEMHSCNNTAGRVPRPSPWYSGYHIMTIHAGKDEAATAVPFDRFGLGCSSTASKCLRVTLETMDEGSRECLDTSM